MRINKSAIIWSIIVSFTALICSLALHYFSFEYWSNLFSGIFASGVLTFMISVINYRTERRKTLEKFYYYAQKVAYNYNRFENESNLERSIESILEMNKFDYLELDNAYGDMSFLFNDKKTRKYIFDMIYNPTLELRQLIEEKSFHFREYRKSLNGNSRVMRYFVDEVAKALMDCNEMKIKNENGVSMVIKTSKNRVVEQLHKELEGHYYEIMYPHIKKAAKKAD